MYRFSIIIATYNSSLFKVLLTIGSILRQSFTDYEIIITDDGSNEDNFSEIESYLLKHNFSKYIFIKNNQNRGIVRNLANAYNKSSGKYIKPISPGDLLFSENTLYELNEFLESKRSNFAFGRLKSYYLENQRIKFHKFVAPSNCLVYKNNNLYGALKNMILKGDYISGATMVFRKSFILNEKYKLNDVIYCEDLVQVLVALNEEKIDFYDSNLIWYEYGSGISTNKKTRIKLQSDHINFFRDIKSKYPNNKIVNKAYKDIMLNDVRNSIIKKILKLLNNPGSIFYKIEKKLYRKIKSHSKNNIGFLIEGNVINHL